MDATSGMERYFEVVFQTLETVRRAEATTMSQVAERITTSLAQGGVLHIFGAGHAHLLAEEISYRAGGLVPVNPILDIGYTLMANPPSRTTALERLEGYARTLMEGYDLRPGEVLIVFSQSGINPGPVEVALYGKEKGLTVVAITSLTQSRNQASRHSSGKRVFEIADLVIDTHIPPAMRRWRLHRDCLAWLRFLPWWGRPFYRRWWLRWQPAGTIRRALPASVDVGQLA